MSKFVSRSYLESKFKPLAYDMEILINSESEKISDYDLKRTRRTIINMCEAIINELKDEWYLKNYIIFIKKFIFPLPIWVKMWYDNFGLSNIIENLI